MARRVSAELAPQARALRLRRVPPRRRSPCAADRTVCRSSRKCRERLHGADRLPHRAGRAASCRPGRSTAHWPIGASWRRSTSATTRVPFYTPEPDVVHEVIGHANMLAEPSLADLYQRAGKASQRATTAEALEFFSRVFWFSLEFGVVWEDGELRAYGAGLLSSYAEIERFRDAEIRPLDIAAMGAMRVRHHPLSAGAVRRRPSLTPSTCSPVSSTPTTTTSSPA